MAAPLIHIALTSLDGFIADAEGGFDWATPDDEVHAFANELSAPATTQLLGRRTYDVMTFWDDVELDDLPPVQREFADAWRAAHKIVYSRTLGALDASRTDLRPEFDPEEVRRVKQESTEPISIAGSQLVSAAARAGLLDELHLLIAPVLVGSGTKAVADDIRLDLELLSQRRFVDGFVHVGYRVLA
jgi:dihydrofolate reductase